MYVNFKPHKEKHDCSPAILQYLHAVYNVGTVISHFKNLIFVFQKIWNSIWTGLKMEILFCHRIRTHKKLKFCLHKICVQNWPYENRMAVHLFLKIRWKNQKSRANFMFFFLMKWTLFLSKKRSFCDFLFQISFSVSNGYFHEFHPCVRDCR